MHHAHVVIGEGPVGVRRLDVDIRLGRHPRVADAVRALELVQAVLVRHHRGIAQVLDQLEPVAEGQDLDTVGLLDPLGQLAGVVDIAQHVAQGVLGRRVLRLHGDIVFRQDLVDRSDPVGDQLVNAMAARPVLGLGDLEAHDELAFLGLAIDRVTGAVRAAMFEGLQHRGHFRPDVCALALVDQSSNSAHLDAPPLVVWVSRCCSRKAAGKRVTCRLENGMPQGRHSMYISLSHSVTVDMKRANSSRLYSS